LASGLAYASGLSLTAGGITLLYITTRTFNFAHASMATWGFYVVYTGTVLYGGTPYRWLPLSFLFGALLGVICYLVLNRHLLARKANTITLMMSTLGYDLVLLAFIQMYCDYLTYSLKLFPRRVTMSVYDIELFGTSGASIILPLTAVAVLSLLHLFITRTKFGTAMRATIENSLLAGASGINSDWVYMASWVIGGGMAALGGAFTAMAMTGTPVLGMTIIPFMFAGAILGGLHSLYGGILGGFVVGLAEYAGVYFLASEVGSWVLGYRMAIPLLIMAVTLMVFPQGLAGAWGAMVGKAAGLRRRGVGA
jgi:branched-chain amino acid transport system permease protein